MTPKERVAAALELREPDRVPWGEHSIDYNVFEMILGRKSYVHAKFAETKAYWDGRRDEVVESYKRDIPDLIRALDMDLVTVHPVVPKGYAPKPMKRLDDETYTDENGAIFKISSVTGDIMEVPINTSFIRRDVSLGDVEQMIEDWDKYYDTPFDPNASEYEVINHVVKELGDTHFVIAAVNGLEWPRFGETEEDGWVNLLLYPEICEKIAEYQMRDTFRTLKSIKKLGVDGILSVGDLGNTTNLFASPDIYRSIIYPWHKKIKAEAERQGLYVLRHCCGHVWPVIDELAETNDAYEGIQERAGMDICKLKDAVGDRLCLWGGILHENIHSGTPEDIRADAKRSFGHAAPGGGFIMGSSHSLAVGAKYENIMEMKRVRDEWGVYPIKLK